MADRMNNFTNPFPGASRRRKVLAHPSAWFYSRVMAAALFAAVLLISCRHQPHSQASSSRQSMVVSAHPLASQAGREVLARGGNAVDAAVAAAFALSVVEPYCSGLGGGGFMLIYPGPGAEVKVLDYREIAPGAATRDMYVREGKLVPGLSTAGPLAVAVPGTVAGLCAALDRFGSLSRSEAMGPAIRLAEDGFTVDRVFMERTLLVLNQIKKDPCAAAILLDHGLPYRPGQKLCQPDLARTLKRIAEAGPEVFYQGELGELLIADLAAKGGIISKEDLAAYRVRWREPVSGSYRGYTIVSMPPPSSGGVAVIETLNILEGYDLSALGAGSVESVHLLAEAMRLAFADRSAFLGDPAFVTVPVAELTSKAYAEQLRQGIDLSRARDSRSITAGSGVIFTGGSQVESAGPGPGEGNHTTHLSVVDARGGAVSLTQTINTTFGSGVAACGTGIILNNEMDDFASAPGEPNVFGLVQGEANAIAPGKVPLSSMSPTLVFKDGRLFMVIGSPGGPRIISTVIQAIVNVVDFGMSMEEAVAFPRVHHQWLPDVLYLEPGLAGRDRMRLLARGHQVKNYLVPCNAQGILVLPDGSLQGASDPRGIGQPAGE